MASGLRQQQGKRDFEIYYEKPWGGMASDADVVDIAPNELAVQQGTVIVNNAHCQFNWPGDPAFLWNNGTSLPTLLFAIQGTLYAVDNLGQIWQYKKFGLPHGWISLIPGVVQAPDYPWAEPPGAVKVVNGKAYITNPTNHSIYVFDPVAATFTLGSAYTGGFFLGVLDDYLLQFNTNDSIDGIQSNRVNWSGPGKFTTWDPSIDQTAGFNTLAACDDQLTGFSSLTSVGLLYSRKTIIEMSPTGVGIQPFNFTTLWTADIGQGGVYPYSITQWGRKTFGLTDTGAFAVSTNGGFESISDKVNSALLKSFQISNNLGNADTIQPLIAGTVMLYFYNSQYATPFYVLVGVSQENLNTLYIWMLDLKTGIWSYDVFDVDTLINQQYGTSFSGGQIDFIRAGSFDLNAIQTVAPDINVSTPFPSPLSVIWLWVNYSGTKRALILTPYCYRDDDSDSGVNTPVVLNLTFRAEEIAIGYTRKPTMRRVVVRGYGSGDLNLTVTGVDGIAKSFGTITLSGTTPITQYSPSGVATVECPQLSITSANFKGVITKVMMAGTFADGAID